MIRHAQTALRLTGQHHFGFNEDVFQQEVRGLFSSSIHPHVFQNTVSQTMGLSIQVQQHPELLGVLLNSAGSSETEKCRWFVEKLASSKDTKPHACQILLSDDCRLPR